MRKKSFVVTLEMPEGVDEDTMVSYIYDAVSCWRGSLNPGSSANNYEDADPLFDLDSETVEVEPIEMAVDE